MADDPIQSGVGSTPGSLLAGKAVSPAHPWTPLTQRSLAVLVAVGLALVGYRGWGLTRFSTNPLPLERATFDLNSVDEIDLQLLPGVGPTLARRLIEHRPYRELNELDRVPGVGPETLTRLRPYLHVTAPPPSTMPPPRVIRARAPDPVPVGGKKKPPAAQVNLNRASVEELATLPGVGPTLAARILEARPFARIDDLRRVRGIGPKTLEKLRPFVVIDEP